MCTGTTRTCVTTCGRGVGTHRDVLNLHTEVSWTDTRGGGGGGRRERGGRVTVSSAHQNLHTGLSPASERFTERKPLDLPNFKFENRSKTTRARFVQSFALPDKLLSSSYPAGHCGGNDKHNTHPPTHHHHHYSLPPLPPTHTTHPHDHIHKHKHQHKETHTKRTHTNAYAHAHTRTCIRVLKMYLKL